MNQDNIHDALNLLDDELIEEVSKIRDQRKKKKIIWVRWGTLAACFCLILVGVYMAENGVIKLGGAKNSVSADEIYVESAESASADSEATDGEGTDDVETEIEAESDYAGGNNNETSTDKATSTTVTSSRGMRSISLQISKGWEYEIIKSAEDTSDEFGIRFWPEGQTEGKISIKYYSAWGVCGTGLEEVKITLGEYSAYQGTYDNKEVWDFISFRIDDTQGYYVALNEGAEDWWEEYGTEAMDILSTVEITEGVGVENLD